MLLPRRTNPFDFPLAMPYTLSMSSTPHNPASPLRLMQLVGPGQGVAFTDVLALARYFRRQAHTLTVVGPLTRLQQEQVTLSRARWVNLPLARYENTEGRASNARQLRRLLHNDPVDLVHCYGLAAAATAVAALPRFGPRPRLVLTLDDLSAYRFTPRQGWAVRRLLRQFGLLIVAADSELQALARVDRGLATRAHLLHFAADVRPITADFDLARK
ncbi:MAG: glycosyltransferase, partial [Armatimonadota bacterium]